MDMDAFRSSLTASRLLHPSSSQLTVDEYAQLFDDEVRGALDRHAPLITRTKRVGRHDNRWLSSTARDAKRLSRRLERRFRRTLSSADKALFTAARKKAFDLVEQSRVEFLRRKVDASVDDPKKLWQTARSLLHTDDSHCEWSDSECKDKCTEFCNYFTDKLGRIRTAIESILVTIGPGLFNDRPHDGCQLASLEPTTAVEVAKLISGMPAKSSPLDTVPTSVLKSCIDIFAPAISTLANVSFAQGVFPARFKTAQVLPLLKKKGLDKAQPSNYRPISNLVTISKLSLIHI